MAESIKNIRHLSKSDLKRVLSALIEKVEELENIIIKLEDKETEKTEELEKVVDFTKLESKEELEEYGKSKGFEVDKRKSIENIKEDITEFLKGAK